MEAPQDRPVRLISEDEYQQFVQRIEGAENQDRAEKLGIWHSSLRFNDVVAIFLDDFVLDDAYSRVRPAASEASKTFELDCRIGTTGDIRPQGVNGSTESAAT